MASTKLTGSVYENREGGVPVTQSKLVSGNATTGTTSLIVTVNASADKPVLIEAQISVLTADSGTSPTVSVGYTTITYNDFINAASTATGSTGGTFLPAANAVGKKILTSTTVINYLQGGTPNGTGVYWIILNITPLNPA